MSSTKGVSSRYLLIAGERAHFNYNQRRVGHIQEGQPLRREYSLHRERRLERDVEQEYNATGCHPPNVKLGRRVAWHKGTNGIRSDVNRILNPQVGQRRLTKASVRLQPPVQTLSTARATARDYDGKEKMAELPEAGTPRHWQYLAGTQTRVGGQIRNKVDVHACIYFTKALYRE